MVSMLFLIPLSLLLLLAAIWVLVWAVNSGQYDDIEREGERILFDDDLPLPGQAVPGQQPLPDDNNGGGGDDRPG
ncbi:MAG: cbb3-type cytochrome oxidase assembly protein CcoS [Porticoccaceae bacterium]|jgi:cbb3-type cytochrome oxidase maturation protein